MLNNRDIFDWVDDFYHKRLSADDQLWFEEELKTNSDLQNELELYQLTEKMVVKERVSNLQEAVSKVHAKKISTKKTTRNIGFAALGLSVIVGTTFLAMNSNDNLEGSTDVISTIDTEEIQKTTKQNTLVDAPVEIKTDAVLTDVNPKTETVTSIIETQNTKVLIGEKSEISKDAIDEKIVSADKNEKQIPTSTPILEETKDSIYNPCSDIKISVANRKVCLKEEDVYIEPSVSGVNNYNIEYVNLENGLVYENPLVVGSYEAHLITDECPDYRTKFRIQSTLCLKDYNIAISNDEKIVIPEIDHAYIFTVYDRVGNLYFEREIDSGTEFEWNGTSNSEAIIEGYYLLTIKYDNGELYKGTVTIAE